jgi:hypothetical protein
LEVDPAIVDGLFGSRRESVKVDGFHDVLVVASEDRSGCTVPPVCTGLDGVPKRAKATEPSAMGYVVKGSGILEYAVLGASPKLIPMKHDSEDPSLRTVRSEVFE